ncbi:MAG: alpha/beta hydrolase, partial [Xanthobacteraceae bacterium]|nr:alpha/beta hydrolase [Xanthobacteraceae bacterium]
AKPHYDEERVEAVRNLRIPALLVRGGSSELVKPEHVKEFLALAPRAKFVDVAGARHMVAGDRNDAFSAAIVDFLAELGE